MMSGSVTASVSQGMVGHEVCKDGEVLKVRCERMFESEAR